MPLVLVPAVETVSTRPTATAFHPHPRNRTVRFAQLVSVENVEELVHPVAHSAPRRPTSRVVTHAQPFEAVSTVCQLVILVDSRPVQRNEHKPFTK
jgi:hypothetical protein